MTNKGSNGCGLFGTLSKIADLFGKHLPFAGCCDEHDLAYEQIETEADRRWADAHFLRCMVERGYPWIGIIFWIIIRAFGWLSFVFRWFREKVPLSQGAKP